MTTSVRKLKEVSLWLQNVLLIIIKMQQRGSSVVKRAPAFDSFPLAVDLKCTTRLASERFESVLHSRVEDGTRRPQQPLLIYKLGKAFNSTLAGHFFPFARWFIDSLADDD